MSARLEFYVEGRPIPQGSTQAFKRGDKIVTTNDPKGTIEKWRGDIRRGAKDALPDSWEVLSGPVALGAVFHFARPASHYLPANSRRPERVLRPDAPTYHDQTPDLDKLLRTVGDALAAVAYDDDRRIARYLSPVKLWASSSGVLITVCEIVE